MSRAMPTSICLLIIMLAMSSASLASDPRVSEQTRSCLNCHEGITPGIVHDWRQSRHSIVTPADALKAPAIERRISINAIAPDDGAVVVGCYECHGLNTDRHEDSFDHYGHRINVIVTPPDCAKCHPVEVEQYGHSKKAHAVGILADNPLYHSLVNDVIGQRITEGTNIRNLGPSPLTLSEACFACHGTVIRKKGMRSVKTAFGPEIQVPLLEGWPNQGVGRINPDGSRGACTSCHTRHAFSIEMARKPYTCGQCHLEPDVPAFNVYMASKHGNIFSTEQAAWDFRAVPWRLGRDFTAPTCATCHVSLVTKLGDTVIAERNHDFGSRLWVRLFGLIYTHPQPKQGDTSIIRNADGLPMPTTFSGQIAKEYLIDEKEQALRKARMVEICKGCHAVEWIDGHFNRLANTIRETDSMTYEATKLMRLAWESGIADSKNPFDESIERSWIKQWLFYANTVRYASAMTGAQDYVAFKYGWWELTSNLEDMREKIEFKLKIKRLLLKDADKNEKKEHDEH